MSVEIIGRAITQFLASDKPEVLCIVGRWGVGKTFGWKKFLGEAISSKNLAIEKYAYVSLFGLSSIDDLKYSIFEKTTSGANISDGSDEKSFSKLLKDKNVVRRFRPIMDAAAAAFNRKGMSDIIAKSAFLAVRNQLICFDDLERSGSGLNAREVLGLMSLLKEERHCKIVLLLNDHEYEDKGDFRKQLEKVSDITLRFDPTPEEAAAIALNDAGGHAEKLRSLINNLKINNIRVIKKIERLASDLLTTLHDCDEGIIFSSLATLTLASWAVQQPSIAPPIQSIKSYNGIAIAMRTGRETLDAETQKLKDLLEDYPYNGANDLDIAIIDGAEAGYFDHNRIRLAAKKVSEDRIEISSGSRFSWAWQHLYHGSLSTDDDTFLDELYESALAEASYISILNINSAVVLLRESGRSAQANQVIEKYINDHIDKPIEFFDLNRSEYIDKSEADEVLWNTFIARWERHNDTRDPLEVLRSMGAKQGWDPADMKLMSEQSASDFEHMFEALRGDEVKRSIKLIRAMGNEGGDEAALVKQASQEALIRIGRKSPLRARKVRAFGVQIDPPA